MAIFTFGEGYHNYHHSFQHDYRNGVKPWQWDPTKWAIWTLKKLGLASDLRTVPEEKIILAELRETQKQADAQLKKNQSWNISCPNFKEAMEQLADLSDKLAEGYAEIEQAASDRVQVSREKLAYWREQVSETLEHLTLLRGMQPQMAA
jgi:stearoyl-CoA desaturase (delta-9 desaturase)